MSNFDTGPIVQGLLVGQNGSFFRHSQRSYNKFSAIFFNVVVPLSVLVFWCLVFTRIFVKGFPPGFFTVSKPIPLIIFKIGFLFNIPWHFTAGVTFLSLMILAPVFYFWSLELLKFKLDAWLASCLFPLVWFYFVSHNLWLGSGLGGVEVLLCLLPFIASCYFLIFFLQAGGVWNFIFTLFFTAVVFLISGLGGFLLILILGILTVSEVFLGEGRIKILRFFLLTSCSLGLVSFWYHPAFYFDWLVSAFELGVFSSWFNALPIIVAVCPVLLSISFLACDRRPLRQGRFFAITSFLVFYFISWFWHDLNKSLFPQSARFFLFLGLPTCLLLGSFLGWLFNWVLKLERRLISWIPLNIFGLNIFSLSYLGSIVIFLLLLLRYFFNLDTYLEGSGVSYQVSYIPSVILWSNVLGFFVSLLFIEVISFLINQYYRVDKSSAWYRILGLFAL